jgi:hypothetical protein
MSEAQPEARQPRVSPYSLVIILIALVLSFASIIFALTNFDQYTEVAWYLLLMGAIGLGLSTYVLFQARKRIASLRIVVPPITTILECRKCGFKNVREFQRGDYVFKEGDSCQKCNDKMVITAIYREVKEKE